METFAGLLMEPYAMDKYKKAGVTKWNRAENARYFDLFFPLCTMWRECNLFSFVTVFYAPPLSGLSYHLKDKSSHLPH